MKLFKSYTSHEANRILGRRGQFWDGRLFRPLYSQRQAFQERDYLYREQSRQSEIVRESQRLDI